MRILIGCLIVILFGACGDNQRTPADALDKDTLVIVASRLFESRTYQNFLEPLAHPVPIRWLNASVMNESELQAALNVANGILLTGGADIHPNRYGQAADTLRCGNIDLERDVLESLLLNEVDLRGLPCLGVCRGMQYMNVHGGGSLHPHLPDALGHSGHRGGVAGNSLDTIHAVIALRDWSSSDWQKGDSSNVVSHHHQGIDRLAEGLTAWAVAPDGLIEGVVRSDTVRYPCYIGVQWHPERSELNQSLVESVGLFFVNFMLAQESQPL
jgi:gamma-glutamyl-gamma-aminobutyrate hydrolase PuuD